MVYFMHCNVTLDSFGLLKYNMISGLRNTRIVCLVLTYGEIIYNKLAFESCAVQADLLNKP